jgi:hypothetical protein
LHSHRMVALFKLKWLESLWSFEYWLMSAILLSQGLIGFWLHTTCKHPENWGCTHSLTYANSWQNSAKQSKRKACFHTSPSAYLGIIFAKKFTTLQRNLLFGYRCLLLTRNICSPQPGEQRLPLRLSSCRKISLKNSATFVLQVHTYVVCVCVCVCILWCVCLWQWHFLRIPVKWHSHRRCPFKHPDTHLTWVLYVWKNFTTRARARAHTHTHTHTQVLCRVQSQ